MDGNVQTILGLDRCRCINGIRFAHRGLSVKTLVITIFRMNGYPPNIIIERKGKLGDLIGYFYFIESSLFWKDISKSQAIVKDPEYNIDQSFLSSPFL